MSFYVIIRMVLFDKIKNIINKGKQNDQASQDGKKQVILDNKDEVW